MQGKRLLILVFVLLFLIGVPGSGYCGGLSGNQLVEYMREFDKAQSGSNPSWYEVGVFMGFVIGVADTLSLSNYINVEGVSIAQACAVVAKYLKANPEKWHESAVDLVAPVLREAFPKEQ